MLAAQAKGFEETLADGRNVDVEFAHAVVDDGRADRGMLGRFVLDDFERADARALLAPRAQEEASVTRGAEQGGARCRQIRSGRDTARYEPRAA